MKKYLIILSSILLALAVSCYTHKDKEAKADLDSQQSADNLNAEEVVAAPDREVPGDKDNRMGSPGENEDPTVEAMKLVGGSYGDGETIPLKYVKSGAGGENVSPAFSWINVPEGTKSFVLAMIDTHPIAKNWVHWIIVDIPASTTSIAEAASGKMIQDGAIELSNSFGEPGYGGPQPPSKSGRHSYVTTLYAVNVEKSEITGFISGPELEKRMSGKIIASAVLTGYYER